MRDAIIITLDLDPNAAAPHGVTPVQPFDRPLKRKPQTPHGILGVNRNGMAAVRMRVQFAHHGFHGGIVKRKHGAASFGAAAMIVATPKLPYASVHPTYDPRASCATRIGRDMPPDEYVRIPEATLRGFDLALLQGLGLSADHAGIEADNLIAADMRGVRTHGHVMLPRYCGEIRDGSTNANAQPRIVSETPAIVHVDGDRALGAVAGHFTMQAVIRKARENGAATGFTKRSNHFGAAAHFAMMALPDRMIGFAATNAGPTMFPFGGRTRMVGNSDQLAKSRRRDRWRLDVGR